MLSIRSIPTRLEFSQTMGRLSMRQTRPEMSVSTRRSEMSVTPDRPRLYVDYTASNESLGRYSPVRFAENIAAEGREAARRGTAQAGLDALAMARSHGQAHASIVRQRIGAYMRDSIMVFAPTFPDMNWHPGSRPDVRFTPHELNVSWTPNRLDIDAERGQLHGRVAQWNRVEIAYLGAGRV